ncbi:MAG TPA: hypothetical protein ENF78_02430 [Candidatus Bathyarchaeota archaeon]|nr:hypothetical protein [Candidatus Bathyarchaeota archaeon]
MGQEAPPEEQIKRLERRLKHFLDTRDRSDAEVRDLKEAISSARVEEGMRAAEELAKRLERLMGEIDDLLTDASATLDRLKAVRLWRRAAAAFGGILIFIGAVAITTGIFVAFLGVLSGLVPPDLELIFGLVAVALGTLLVLSGFAHQVP